MHQERKQLLIDALLSGKYQQATGSLRRIITEVELNRQYTVIKHCCLGVGTEVFMEYNPGVLQRTMDRFETLYSPVNEPLSADASFLPIEVANWFETEIDPVIEFPKPIMVDEGIDKSKELSRCGLSFLNDRCGLTFPQIADCIRYFL